MKLKDLFLNWVINTPLFEMAFERKVLINKVRNLQDALSEHLIKLLALNMPENVNHWQQEINGYLDLLQRYKLRGRKGRTLSGPEFKEILWNEPLGDGIVEMQSLLNSLGKFKGYPIEQRTILNDHQLYEVLEKIYHEISYDLANHKVEPIQHYISRFVRQ